MSRTYHHGNKAKQRRFGRNWWWLWNEPSWWHLMTTHVPARATTKSKLHAVKAGAEDDGNWPDHRKPHVYYW